MSSRNDEQTNDKKILKEHLINEVRNLKPKQLLKFAASLVLVFFAIVFVEYQNQPGLLNDTGSFAATAVENALGEGYEGDANVERRQAIQIIYEVLYDLWQKGFDEPKSTGEIISWAKSCEVLKGRNSGFCEEEPATKQESLVFLARSLGIQDELFAEERPVFSKNTVFDRWTRPQIEGLVIAGHLRIADIDDLGDLRKTITASEMIELMGHIVTIKTHVVGYCEIARSWLSNNQWYLLCTIFTLILAGIEPVILLWDRVKRWIEEKEEQADRTGAIFLVGIPGVGKTTLKEQIMTEEPSDTLPCRYKKTNDYTEEVVRFSFGKEEVLFEGIICDGPGDNKENVHDFFSAPNRKNVILLLVLAHTKANKDDKMASQLINQQLYAIDYFWKEIISKYNEKLKKVVVFINKTDLLPQKKLPAERHIYKRHIKLLKAGGGEPTVHVVEGSALSKESVENLRKCMFPRPPYFRVKRR